MRAHRITDHRVSTGSLGGGCGPGSWRAAYGPRRTGERRRAGHHPAPRQHLPALRPRSMVPQEMAPESPGRRSDNPPLCRQYRGRVPTQAGCGAGLPRRSGKGWPGLVSASTRTKTYLVKFGRFSIINRRQRGAGKPEVFDFRASRIIARPPRGRFRLGRKPVAKRVNRTLARIDEVLRKR